MKTSIGIFVFMLASICAFAQSNHETSIVNTGASINWSSATTYDFGNVKKGTPVTSTFEFTNNGNEPLIISEAKGSCGCTAVEYTQKPIAPGAKGFVKATFNSSSIGAFYKSVTVSANISSKAVVLNIKGQVVE